MMTIRSLLLATVLLGAGVGAAAAQSRPAEDRHGPVDYKRAMVRVEACRLETRRRAGS